MKKIFAFTIAALSLLGVSCNKEVAPEVSQAPATIAKTFTVNAPESTKTELNGPKSVVWSKGDAITVIAKTTQNQYTFTIKNGEEGKASAVFQGTIGEADKDETEFYAFYPATTELALNDTNYPLSGGNITVKSSPDKIVKAVKDGYDASRAYMTAISADANDSFTFRHGMAYLKIKLSYPGLKSVRFSNDGSGKFVGRPSFNVQDGTTTALQGTKSSVELVADDCGAGRFDAGHIRSFNADGLDEVAQTGSGSHSERKRLGGECPDFGEYSVLEASSCIKLGKSNKMETRLH